jgi:DNA-binding PadR family transcriptional regulator
MTRSRDARDYIPLTDVAFQIMLALAHGPAHGYAVMIEVERRAGQGLRLRPGTLYRAINRLSESGLLEESEERPAPELDDERRRYYRLTELGRSVAAAEARRRSEELEWAREAGLLQPRNA